MLSLLIKNGFGSCPPLTGTCLPMDSGPAEISSFRNTASQPSASESAVYLDWQVAPEQLELNHCSTGPPEKDFEDHCLCCLSQDWVPTVLQSSCGFPCNQVEGWLVCDSLHISLVIGFCDVGSKLPFTGCWTSSAPMGSVSHGAQGLVSQWKVAHSALSYLTLQATFSFQIILPGFYLWKTVGSICVKYPAFNYEVLKSIFSYLACLCMCMHVRVRAPARTKYRTEHPFN